MGFAEHYVLSLNSSNLMDDTFHHLTEPLFAAAAGDMTGAGLGAILSRVKFANGIPSKEFESGTANLAQLLKLWLAAVTEKGRARGWMKVTASWDVTAAYVLYRRVAEASLAHWLDGRCTACGGSGLVERRVCTCCAGNGKAEIEAGRFESQLIADMVGELEGLVQAHNGRAARRLRRFDEAL